MTTFEFIFALYSLLLGLALAEILTGLGRAIEHRYASDAADTAFELGWLTPLLAVFVILDLLSFWAFAWVAREHLQVSTQTLLAVVAFASCYYLAARLVFPSDPKIFRTLDTHYFRVRRIILLILVALVFAQWGFNLSVPAINERVFTPFAVGMTAVLVAGMAATAFIRNRTLSIALLLLLCARYLYLYLT